MKRKKKIKSKADADKQDTIKTNKKTKKEEFSKTFTKTTTSKNNIGSGTMPLKKTNNKTKKSSTTNKSGLTKSKSSASIRPKQGLRSKSVKVIINK